MADTDTIVLENAASAASMLDMRYRKALRARDPKTLELRQKADEAMQEYGLARMKLIEKGVVTTDADVSEMAHIRSEIQNAADTQTCIEGAVKLVAFLARIAAV